MTTPAPADRPLRDIAIALLRREWPRIIWHLPNPEYDQWLREPRAITDATDTSSTGLTVTVAADPPPEFTIDIFADGRHSTHRPRR